jgi:hypothetical protein
MLASLLPGVREIRAPLAAGYLWLFALWLALEPFPSAEEATGLEAAVIDLADAGTPVAVAVVLSFVAYLVGSLADVLVRGYRRWLLTPVNAYGGPSGGRRMLGVPNLVCSSNSYGSLQVVAAGRVREAESKLEAVGKSLESLPNEFAARKQFVPSGGTLARTVSAQVTDLAFFELPLISTRLMWEQPELFSAVDRLRAEAELRWALPLPLVVTLCVLAIRGHWTWILGLLVVVLMLYQAGRREREAGDLVVDAIWIGRVEAPAFERLRRAVELEVT